MADFLWLKAEHQGNMRGDGDEEFLGTTWRTHVVPEQSIQAV